MIEMLSGEQTYRNYFANPLIEVYAPREAEITHAILKDAKNRIVFLTYRKFAPPDQSADITLSGWQSMVYFVGLVNGIDTITDNDKFNFEGNGSGLLPQLMETEIPIGPKYATAKELVDLILQTNPRAEDIVMPFLEQAAKIQPSSRAVPGTYSYDDAVQYRFPTSAGMSKVCAQLAGATEPHLIKNAENHGMSWQLLDDVADSFKDLKGELTNLFIGMAHDTAPDELDVLAEYAHTEQTLKLRERIKILQKMSNTREAYLTNFNEYFYPTSAPGGIFIAAVRRLLLGK